MIKNHEAIIVVDCQFDFTIAGRLPVPHANGKWITDICESLLRERALDRQFSSLEPVKIIATQDWHPNDHISFSQWPAHCVQKTAGSELVFDEAIVDKVIYKGSHSQYDSYSAFEDNDGNTTPLQLYLDENGIMKLTVFGLATDYCVKATVLDALDLKYRVKVILDLCRGVDPATTEQAIKAVKKEGAIFV